jgi:hypothetical protein
MARFKEPGFMTRQVQRNMARFGQPIAPVATTSMMKPNIPGPLKRPRLGVPPSWLIRDIAAPFRNPCREINLASDPFEQRGHMARMVRGTVGPVKARPVNKWEDYDTHKPRGWRVCFRDSHRYTQRLQAHGYRALGSGFYSTVLGHKDSDKVIKICRNGGDDAYPMFAEWAYQNPSPYLPRIHSFKRHNGFYVVVLDKLAKTTGDSHPNEGWSLTTDMFESYCRGNEFKGMRKTFLDAAFNELPGLKPVLDAFVKEFKGEAHFDMHANNWMLSSTGQLVMTDPLSGTSTETALARNNRVSRLRSALRPVA